MKYTTIYEAYAPIIGVDGYEGPQLADKINAVVARAGIQHDKAAVTALVDANPRHRELGIYVRSSTTSECSDD